MQDLHSVRGFYHQENFNLNVQISNIIYKMSCQLLVIVQSLQRKPDRHYVHSLGVPHGLAGREDVSQQELHHQHDHLGVGNLPRHAGTSELDMG